MATAGFENLGFDSGGAEADAVDFLAGALGGTVTGTTKFHIDYGGNNTLTVGEQTTIGFRVTVLDGATPVTTEVTISGTYIGHDETLSPHIDPTGISAVVVGTGVPVPITPLQNALFASLGDMRVTNDPGFPETGAGQYPAVVAQPLAICFAAGTLIATPEGERAVEDLRPGDEVLTADGRVVAVKWLGHQTLVRHFAGERSRPVRVAPGALGPGMPHRELVLTADHALILDGLAINAGALVNGQTITCDALRDVPERATYYHVETEDHEVILANGAAAESFIDYVGRAAFDNYADYLALYGEPETISEMPLPRISSARLVPASIRSRLAAARRA